MLSATLQLEMLVELPLAKSLVAAHNDLKVYLPAMSSRECKLVQTFPPNLQKLTQLDRKIQQQVIQQLLIVIDKTPRKDLIKEYLERSKVFLLNGKPMILFAMGPLIPSKQIVAIQEFQRNLEARKARVKRIGLITPQALQFSGTWAMHKQLLRDIISKENMTMRYHPDWKKENSRRTLQNECQQ